MTIGRRLPAWLAVAVIAVSHIAAAGDLPPAEKRSGYEFMTPETRAMQDDDDANPGMLSVLDGEELWSRAAGEAARSCADCHGKAVISMKGVAARYPALDKGSGRPVDLEQRINACRKDRQRAPPLPYESRELLALTAYVAHQSKGEPIEVPDHPRTRPFIAAGKMIFEQRQGQLNLSCAQCHDDNWGKHLGGTVIPQAHPTGYPLYRLEWQRIGSLRRRLRNCLVGMRAAPYPENAPEIVDLELFLAWRARGLALETPAVRP